MPIVYLCVKRTFNTISRKLNGASKSIYCLNNLLELNIFYIQTVVTYSINIIYSLTRVRFAQLQIVF